MIPNRLKQLWSGGKPTINGWCSIGNPFAAAIMAAQGFDSVTVDPATPGLDGIHVGPSDLSLSLRAGRLAPGFDRDAPEILAALHRIAAACKANNIPAALRGGSPDYAARAIAWGYHMTTVGGDSRCLAAGAGAAGFRKLTDTTATKTEKEVC